MNHVPTKLLWTGGWDSSFRLFDLIIMQKRPVLLYYVSSPSRRSLPYELRAMDDILEALHKTYGDDTADLVQDFHIYEEAQIEPDGEIEDAFKRLKSKIHIGDQYLFLAKFAKTFNLRDVEVSIQLFERGSGVLNHVPKDDFVEDADGAYLVDEPSDPDIKTIFGAVRFPVKGMTKLDMLDIARKNGFDHLLFMTHFCHKPRKGGKPCGKCNPCRDVMIEGLGMRLDRLAKFNYFAKRVKSWIRSR